MHDSEWLSERRKPVSGASCYYPWKGSVPAAFEIRGSDGRVLQRRTWHDVTRLLAGTSVSEPFRLEFVCYVAQPHLA